MVKNALKKVASLVFCLAILISCVMVSFVQADDYCEDPYRVTIYRDMSREECWRLASNRNIGLSRERIAVEIFAKSQQKARDWNNEIHTIVLASGYCVVGVGAALYTGSTAPLKLCQVSAVVGAFEVLGKFGEGDTIKLGDDSEAEVKAFYDLWNADTGKHIYSALDNNMAVDVNGNSNKNGTKVQLWSKNESGAQNFYILPTGDGNWCNVFKAGTFKCLDVAGGKAEAGVNVQLWEYNGTAAQDWECIAVPGKAGYVYLRSRVGNGEYYLDARGGVNANGTQLQIWTPNQTTAQQWKIA